MLPEVLCTKYLMCIKNMLGWGVKNNCVMSGKCNLSVEKTLSKKKLW